MYHRVNLHRKKRIRRRLLRMIGLTSLLLYLALTGCWEIRDGDSVRYALAVFPAYRSIARRAGIALDPLDICTATGRQITIDRAPVVELTDHGERRRIPAREKTVGALLNRLGIVPGPMDAVRPSINTPLTDGLELRIDRLEQGREVYCAAVPAETEYILNPELPLWQETVLSAGSDGEVRITAEVDYVNGTAANRNILEQEILREAVPWVIELGTGEPKEERPVIRGSYICLPDGQQLHFTRTMAARVSGFLEEGITPGTAATDPRVIPYGTRMYIAASDGSYFYGCATSTNFGRQVTGSQIEVYLPSIRECIDFGVKDCTVYFLG